MTSYSDKNKRDYMKMFFDDRPAEFCKFVIERLALNDFHSKLLIDRYVNLLSDKEIANNHNPKFHKDYVNKEIAKALVKAYDSLKTLQLSDFMTDQRSKT